LIDDNDDSDVEDEDDDDSNFDEPDAMTVIMAIKPT